MDRQNYIEKTGLCRIPEYWDKRYTKNLDKLSKPIYTVKKEESIPIVLRDGITIYADIYHPKEGGKFPALLTWSAYGKEMQALKRGTLSGDSLYFDHTLEAGDIDFYVERGYTFVIPDPRGIGASEGEFLGIYNPIEVEDVCDTIEWLGISCDWCDGNVAMLGYSYFGIIQPLVAAKKPPHLKCIMPIGVAEDYYQHGHYGGVANTYMSMYWALCPANNPVSWTYRMEGKEKTKELIKQAKNDPDIAVISFFTKMLNVWPPKYHTFFLDFLLHPQDGKYWQERSAQTYYDEIDVPVYFKCGWAPNGRWSAPVLNSISDDRLSCYKRIAVMESYGGMELPYRFMNEEQLRWYDHWLKDIDTGIVEEPPMKMNIIGGGYRYEYEYPLARTIWKKLYLRTFEELRWDPDPEGNLQPDTFSHRPPNITTKIETLVYRSGRFTRPMEFTGPIELRLFASIDAEDAIFIVKLWQITAGGTRMPLCRYGALRASHRYDEERSKIARPAHDHTKRVAVKPGEINEYVIEVNPIGLVFSPGTSIELEIKAMDPFEHQDKAWEAKLDHMGPIPSSKTINYKIYRDKDYQSHILLPYIPYTEPEQYLQPLNYNMNFGENKGTIE